MGVIIAIAYILAISCGFLCYLCVAFNMDDAFDVDAYGNAKQPFHTFSNPRYYGFIAGLLRMRNLKKLSLRKNNLSDYTASVVWKCRSLTDLDLSDNKFECLPPDIASSRTLVTCRLKNNDFKCSSASEMMALLGSSSRLEVLDLGGNKNMEVSKASNSFCPPLHIHVITDGFNTCLSFFAYWSLTP